MTEGGTGLPFNLVDGYLVDAVCEKHNRAVHLRCVLVFLCILNPYNKHPSKKVSAGGEADLNTNMVNTTF